MISKIELFKTDKLKILFDQAIFSGSTLMLTILLARVLSKNEFGNYSMLVLVSFLFISLSNALIIQPFQISHSKLDSCKEYEMFLFKLQLFILFILLILEVSMYFVFEYYHLPFVAACLFFNTTILFDFFRKLFYTKKSLNQLLALDITITAFQFISLWILYVNNTFTLSAVLFALSTANIVGCVFGIIACEIKITNISFQKNYMQHHINEGKWLGLVSLIQWTSGNLFIITSAAIISVDAFGAFRLVQSIFGVLNVLFQVFENVVLPNASKIYAKSINDSKKYIRSVSRDSVLAIGVILLLIGSFAKPLLSIVSVEKYLEYSFLVIEMCVLYLILFIGYPIRISIRMLLLNKDFFVGHILSLVFSLLFFEFLLRKMNLNGLMIGLIANQIIMLIFWNYKLTKNKFNLWK